MVVQMLFCERDILDGAGVTAALELYKLVYPNPAHAMLYESNTPANASSHGDS
jgi:hypothetical protein